MEKEASQSVQNPLSNEDSSGPSISTEQKTIQFRSTKALNTWLLAIVVLIFVTIAGFGGYTLGQRSAEENVHTQVIDTPTPIPQEQTDQPQLIDSGANAVSLIQPTDRSGWKKYTNTSAQFSIEFPDKLSPYYEETGAERGVVFLCADSVEPGTSGKCADGFELRYQKPVIDGKGGGCDQADHQQIVFLGRNEDVCLGNNYLNLVYARHPAGISEVSFYARFTEKLSKSEMLSILNTFSFTK